MTYVCLVFLPARFTHMRASLGNQNKCKLSIKLQEEFPPVEYHLCWICTSKKKALKTINFCFSVIFCNLL